MPASEVGGLSKPMAPFPVEYEYMNSGQPEHERAQVTHGNYGMVFGCNHSQDACRSDTGN